MGPAMSGTDTSAIMAIKPFCRANMPTPLASNNLQRVLYHTSHHASEVPGADLWHITGPWGKGLNGGLQRSALLILTVLREG